MTKPNQTRAQIRAMQPSEDQEVIAVIQWCGAMMTKWPCLREIMHIHNEGKRGWITQRIMAAIKKYLGGQAGIHDLHLPVSRTIFFNVYHSLYIEMKRSRLYFGTDKAIEAAYSAKQRAWAKRMTALGHRCEVAYGADEAIKILEEYLS